jgi:hypothetical protein
MLSDIDECLDDLAIACAVSFVNSSIKKTQTAEYFRFDWRFVLRRNNEAEK